MRIVRYTVLLSLISIVAVGCAAKAVRTRAPGVTSLTLPAKLSSSVRVARLAGLFANAYARDDWGAVRAAFVNPATARSLVDQMNTWKSENVHVLDVSVVYRAAAGRGRYIGTLAFSGDPRTIASYAVYVFGSGRNAGRIIGTTTGISGTNYLHATWSMTRSEHFTIFHSPYQLRGSDRAALPLLEYQRRQFMRRFGVKVAQHIAYYYYPVQRLMSPLTGHACGVSPGFVGCADPDVRPPTIHSSEWPTYHEPIHVYELALEPPHFPGKPPYVAPLFIGEGTAVALEDKEADPRLSDYCSDLRYVPLDTCAQQALGDVNPIRLLSDTGFGKANAGDAYSLCGSFVKYLILGHGYHLFGRFYYVLAAQPLDREKDYDVAAETVYHQRISKLLEAWRNALCRNGAC